MKTPSTKMSARSGFSLVELLVVIAVIAIIAAIALPNIANITSGAREASAQRNAQNAASTWAAAVAAGHPTNGVADGAAVLAALVTGIPVTPAGSTNTMNFRLDGFPAAGTEGYSNVLNYLTFTNGNLLYTPN